MKFTINRETPAQKFGYMIIAADKRGEIKGSLPPRPARKGGDLTNAEYAAKHGITKRQASIQRRGY